MEPGWYKSAYEAGRALGVALQYDKDLRVVAGVYRDQGYSEEKALEMAKEKLKKVSA